MASVVVCSYNGATTLGRCLEALERQTLRERLQLIVVDDGSTDGTAAVAGRFDVELLVHRANRGLGAARNTGLQAARAPIVAFTDDDCLPAPCWVEELLGPYRRDQVGGVGGPVTVARVETLVQRYLLDNNPLAPLELELAASSSLGYRVALYLRRMWRPPETRGARAVYSFPGANMSFRRELLEAVGGFDPKIAFGGDDEQICGLLRRAFPDRLLWLAPDAGVAHDFRGTLADLCRRNLAYGKGQARAFLDEPGRRWPVVFPVPLALLLLLAPCLRRPRRLLALALGLPAALPQGLLAAGRHHRPAELTFSYLRLLEESAHDLGVLTGLLRELAVRTRPAGARPAEARPAGSR